jgi:hypothetical protein
MATPTRCGEASPHLRPDPDVLPLEKRVRRVLCATQHSHAHVARAPCATPAASHRRNSGAPRMRRAPSSVDAASSVTAVSEDEACPIDRQREPATSRPNAPRRAQHSGNQNSPTCRQAPLWSWRRCPRRLALAADAAWSRIRGMVAVGCGGAGAAAQTARTQCQWAACVGHRLPRGRRSRERQRDRGHRGVVRVLLPLRRASGRAGERASGRVLGRG